MSGDDCYLRDVCNGNDDGRWLTDKMIQSVSTFFFLDEGEGVFLKSIIY